MCGWTNGDTVRHTIYFDDIVGCSSAAGGVIRDILSAPGISRLSTTATAPGISSISAPTIGITATPPVGTQFKPPSYIPIASSSTMT